jgi:hypothetical protein
MGFPTKIVSSSSLQHCAARFETFVFNMRYASWKSAANASEKSTAAQVEWRVQKALSVTVMLFALGVVKMGAGRLSVMKISWGSLEQWNCTV